MHNGCKEYSDWETFRNENKGPKKGGGISGFLRANKPKHSPNVKKWFNKGGTIEINDGVWTYKMKRDGQVYSGTYTKEGYVTFSDNCLHPEYSTPLPVGSFSNDRGIDRRNFANQLFGTYGVTIPKDYAVHHVANTIDNEMLLVDEEWHSLFTHKGGFSQNSNK